VTGSNGNPLFGIFFFVAATVGVCKLTEGQDQTERHRYSNVDSAVYAPAPEREDLEFVDHDAEYELNEGGEDFEGGFVFNERDQAFEYVDDQDPEVFEMNEQLGEIDERGVENDDRAHLFDEVEDPAPEQDSDLQFGSLKGWVVRVSSSATILEAQTIAQRMRNEELTATVVLHDYYYCVLLGSHSGLGRSEAEQLKNQVAHLFAADDQARLHDASTWCPKQVDMGDHVRCVKWTAQIAASRDEAFARRQALIAERTGFDTFVYVTDDRLYRVFAGQFVSQRDFKAHREELGQILGLGVNPVHLDTLR